EEDTALLCDPGSLSAILSRASAVIQGNIAAARLRDQPADYCITPAVGNVGIFDLNRAAEAIEAGRTAARAALPELLESLGRAPAGSASATRWWRETLAARVPATAAA